MTEEIKDMVTTENLVEGVEYTVEAVEEVAKVAKSGGTIGNVMLGLGAVAATGAAIYFGVKTVLDDKPKKEKKAKKAKKKWKLVRVEVTPEEEVTEETEVNDETEE